MAKFKFQIEAGCFLRKQVRVELERSKDKLEYSYPGSSMTVREENGIFDSTFFIQGVNFPDTDEFEKEIKNWFKKIEMAAQ